MINFFVLYSGSIDENERFNIHPKFISCSINMGETTEEINDIIQNMRIPDTIFSEVESDPNQVPKHPVLVFINAKSGGQLGSELLKSYRAVLSENQVRKLC
jgi:diacylglycerol kinase (ATP)